MRFTPEAIELAQRLKTLGLVWTPSVGHFVWDGERMIEAESPFHDRVFFILDLKHFLRRSGTIERLAESMTWLPTWEQARRTLQSRGVPDAAVANHLYQVGAIESGTEHVELYRLLEQSLTTTTEPLT